jgi:hypothetical protein
LLVFFGGHCELNNLAIFEGLERILNFYNF